MPQAPSASAMTRSLDGKMRVDMGNISVIIHPGAMKAIVLDHVKMVAHTLPIPQGAMPPVPGMPGMAIPKPTAQMPPMNVQELGTGFIQGIQAVGKRYTKRSAADAGLFEREGRAVVFASPSDLAARIDDPALDVEPGDFLVMQNAGPRSGYGMPEAGYLPLPAKLARAGVKDMVRISDARMSGTAYGTVVLHVSPESAAGGPLALVRSGDRIRLSVRERRLDLEVNGAELAQRQAEWQPPPLPPRGYRRLYAERVLQAEHGCDFDFLRA